MKLYKEKLVWTERKEKNTKRTTHKVSKEFETKRRVSTKM